MSELAVYTTSQVARRFYVDSSAVRLWVKQGKLQPLTRTPGGHYRFDAAYIENVARAGLPTTPSPEIPSPTGPSSGEGVPSSSAA